MRGSQEKTTSNSATPSRRREWRTIGWLIALLAAVIVSVPILGGIRIVLRWSAKEQMPPEPLARLLQGDFGLALPDGAVVVHECRLPAGIDSAAAYEVVLPPADLSRFMEQLSAAAKENQWEKEDNESAPAIAGFPVWWQPEAAGVTRWSGFCKPGRAMYVIGSSPSGRCFIHWLTF